jgi:tRNA A37 N6-isopentenylltransferase MiaA
VVLAIYGPTASGKTAVAEAIAAQIPAELISADAAAMFRGLEVLTAARLIRRASWECLTSSRTSVGEFETRTRRSTTR